MKTHATVHGDFPYCVQVINAIMHATSGVSSFGMNAHVYQVNTSSHTIMCICLSAVTPPDYVIYGSLVIHDALNDMFSACSTLLHRLAGVFTFQVSLFPSGEIHFVYKEVSSH